MVFAVMIDGGGLNLHLVLHNINYISATIKTYCVNVCSYCMNTKVLEFCQYVIEHTKDKDLSEMCLVLVECDYIVLALNSGRVVLPGPACHSTEHRHGPGGAAADDCDLAEDTRIRTRPTGGSTA